MNSSDESAFSVLKQCIYLLKSNSKPLLGKGRADQRPPTGQTTTFATGIVNQKNAERVRQSSEGA